MVRRYSIEAGERGRRVFNIQIFEVNSETGRNGKAVNLPVYADDDNYPTKEELRKIIKKTINSS